MPTLPYNFPFFSLMKHLPVTIVSDRTPMTYELDLLLITPFIKLKFHSCAVCIYSTSFKTVIYYFLNRNMMPFKSLINGNPF